MGFLAGTQKVPTPIINTGDTSTDLSSLGPRPDPSSVPMAVGFEGRRQQVEQAAAEWDKKAAAIQAQGSAGTPDYLKQTNFSPTDFSGNLATQAGIQQTGLANALQARGQTQGLIGDLQAQAAGQGPSLAQSQLREATDRNANLAAGAIASQRGINPALAARMITQQQASANQQAAGQSADLRMQEQMAARQQLAGVLAQQQGLDLGYGAQGLQGAGIYGQLNAGQQSLAAQLSEAEKQRQMQVALANQQAQLHTADTNAGISSSNNQQAASVTGGVVTALGAGAMMMSDERAKQNVHPAGPALDKFMSSMGEHSYQYKDPSNGPGTRFGPMAQEMEHSAVGKSIVHDTPQGKVVDMRAALSAALAGQARLNERLEALEGGKKMAKGGVVRKPETLTKANIDDKPRSADFRGEDSLTNEDLDKALNGPEPKKMAMGGPIGAVAPGMSFGQKLGGVLSTFGQALGGGTPGFNSGLVQLGQALRQKQQAQAAATPGLMGMPGLSTANGASGLLPQPTGTVAPQQSLMGGPAAMMGGGRVPGKAEVSGDSERNDKVPALLSPGEIVIPRSKAKDPDQAKAFVEAIANHKGPEDEADGYGKVLQHTRDLHERLKKIEHALGGMVY